MSRLTPNQLKAIGWYAEEHGLKLSLSAVPYIFYIAQHGEEVQKHILTITALWKRDRREKKRANLHS